MDLYHHFFLRLHGIVFSSTHKRSSYRFSDGIFAVALGKAVVIMENSL